MRGPPDAPDTATISQAEARQLPGAFGDPFRAIESLPGVLPLASGVPYFYVRGAPPGNVGYFLDGVRVPLLYHLGLGPSVLSPALITQVELVPGPAPELGRHAGGVVKAELAEPRDTLRVEGSLRAVDTGAFLEVPFDDGRGAAMATGRFSYAAWLFSLASSSTSLSYWDYASRVAYDVARETRVTLFGFGAYDFLSEKNEAGEEERVFDTTFHRVNLKVEHAVDERTRFRQDVVVGWDQTGLDQAREVKNQTLELRSAVTHRASPDAELRFGFGLTADAYGFDLNRGGNEGFVTFFESRTDLALGVWAVTPLRLGRLALSPGVRADVYASSHHVAASVDPSVGAELALTEHVSVATSHGLASQMPSFIVAGPGFRPGLDQGGLQRTFHSSAGVSYAPDGIWTLRGTLYRLAFFDVNDALGTSPLSGEGFPDGFEEFDQRFLGTSAGLELSLRRRVARGWGASLAYTLGRSERSHRGRRLPSGFDRTHVASAALLYDFGAGFRGGVRNLVYSGAPLLTDDADGRLTVKDRLGPFYRFDWRFEKRWTFGETGFVALVAEVANSLLASEETGEDCVYDVGSVNGEPVVLRERCRRTRLGPVTIPSLGVEGGY